MDKERKTAKEASSSAVTKPSTLPQMKTNTKLNLKALPRWANELRKSYQQSSLDEPQTKVSSGEELFHSSTWIWMSWCICSLPTLCYRSLNDDSSTLQDFNSIALIRIRRVFIRLNLLEYRRRRRRILQAPADDWEELALSLLSTMSPATEGLVLVAVSMEELDYYWSWKYLHLLRHNETSFCFWRWWSSWSRKMKLSCGCGSRWEHWWNDNIIPSLAETDDECPVEIMIE